METFGERLRALRKANKLSQPDFAKQIGVSNGMISFWENNISEPSLSNLIILARFFGVTSDYLIGLSDKKTKE